MERLGPATYVDVVDTSDNVVGRADRGELGSNAHNFRVTHVFVVNAKKELLLGRLGVVRTNDPGLWGSSVAAHVWAGETYDEAAARRLKEELGIAAQPEFLAKLSVHEGSATKFVALFEAASEQFENQEPEHQAELVFVPLGEVARRLADQPETFTGTFRTLFAAYWRERQGPDEHGSTGKAKSI